MGDNQESPLAEVASERAGSSDQRSRTKQRVIAQLRGAAETPPPNSDEGRGKTAFIYVRVSTVEQARTGGGEEGYSIPAQRTSCVDKVKQLIKASVAP